MRGRVVVSGNRVGRGVAQPSTQPRTITSTAPGAIFRSWKKVFSVMVFALTRGASPRCDQPKAASVALRPDSPTVVISSSTALEKGPAAESSTVSPSRSPTHCVCTCTRGELPACRSRAASA